MQASTTAVVNLLLLSNFLHWRVEARVPPYPVQDPGKSTFHTPDLACPDPQQRLLYIVPLAWAYPCKRPKSKSVTSNSPRTPRTLHRASRSHYTMSEVRSSNPLPLATVPDRADSPKWQVCVTIQKQIHQTSRENSSGCDRWAQFRAPVVPRRLILLLLALHYEWRRYRLRPCRLDSRGSALVCRTCGLVPGP